MQNFSLNEYGYHLPEVLIAQDAVSPAHNAKLMVINRNEGSIDFEWSFIDLSDLLWSDDILFFNNSRVVRSRIRIQKKRYRTKLGHHGIIEDGEIFYLASGEGNTFEALVRPGNKMKIGTMIEFEKFQLTIEDQTESGRKIKIEWGSIFELMEQYGELPLPPYIEYKKEKEKDYQTTFAKKDGSVAAPTASLHFTQELLDQIVSKKEYITLHVGIGTFKGIDTHDIREYQIHGETIEIQKNLFEKIAQYKNEWKNLIAVGTTVCRTLESMSYLWNEINESTRWTFSEPCQQFWNTTPIKKDTRFISQLQETQDSFFATTEIYIYPGYHFTVIDSLITNFHLPKSSLLVLVSSLIGYWTTMKIYQYAIEKWYRFFSFWDGMYIRKSH